MSPCNILMRHFWTKIVVHRSHQESKRTVQTKQSANISLLVITACVAINASMLLCCYLWWSYHSIEPHWDCNCSTIPASNVRIELSWALFMITDFKSSVKSQYGWSRLFGILFINILCSGPINILHITPWLVNRHNPPESVMYLELRRFLVST